MLVVSKMHIRDHLVCGFKAWMSIVSISVNVEALVLALAIDAFKRESGLLNRRTLNRRTLVRVDVDA